MEQMVKISAFAAILTSGFINLNDGHSGQKPGSLVCRSKQNKVKV